MNGYKAFYNGKTLDILATNSYQAQEQAAKQFKAKKSYQVTVMLCEKEGKQVIHSTVSI